MSKIIAVIGSGYGDEGKGLMTDYYASKFNDSVVVRSNGGAQAGHTVTTPDGKRHVFSHVSSGTLSGASTYLSEFFVANPLLLGKELKKLEGLGVTNVNISANPLMLITTPYDMLINQRFETVRGEELHGSVGVGFGETIERAWTHSALRLHHVKEWDKDDIVKHLRAIRDEYFPSRIDMSKASDPFKELLNSDEIMDMTITSIDKMKDLIIMNNYSSLADKETIIFEGAQGLQLDQDYGYFPHVTRSNCGMRNIRQILEWIPDQEEEHITVNYVTRAYTTRHGAGPLDREDNNIRIRHNIIDNTNMENDWQGRLRLAPLNLDMFNSITDKDFLNYAPRGSKKMTTVTCLDQLNGGVTWIDRDISRYMSADVVRKRAREKFDFCSFGPTRNDVVDFSEEG